MGLFPDMRLFDERVFGSMWGAKKWPRDVVAPGAEATTSKEGVT